MKNSKFIVILALLGVFCLPSFGLSFTGLESKTLPPVSENWGLKIMILNVGQADAIIVMAPNGEVALIDSGKYKKNGFLIRELLSHKSRNGIGNIETIDLVYTTHYDSDHIGGLPALLDSGIRIRKAFDQGLSVARHMTTGSGNPSIYAKYVTAVGDLNNNYIQDPGEGDFVRHRMEYGHKETIGLEDNIEILCVAVRGDTKGNAYDHHLDPAANKINENPGSIALLIRLGSFEFYTAGDQTCDDWKAEEPTEEAVIESGAIIGGNDIDVIKVSHHGSNTSTSKELVTQMKPEVAVISSTWYKKDRLPKKNTLALFQDYDTYVLITGDGVNREITDKSYQDYSAATKEAVDDRIILEEAVFNNQGDVTILVSTDGSRYTVAGHSFDKTFSSIDEENITARRQD